MDAQINHSKISLSGLESIGIGAGTMTAGGLIFYFILAKAFHFVDIIQLRYLNFFILLGGILLAMNKYKRSNAGHVEYLEGFFLGMFTTAIASLLFAVFVGVYLTWNADFMNFIKSTAVMGDY